MQVIDRNGNATELKFKLPEFNLSPEEMAEHDKKVIEELHNFEMQQRQMAYENCGVGIEYKKCTIYNFVETEPKQKEMKNQARKFALKIKNGDISNMLLFGNAGQGKTRLMCSLLNFFAKEVKSVRYDMNEYYVVEYQTSKDICDALNKTKSYSCGKTYDRVINDLVFADILAIDEVGKGGTGFEYDCLFSILDKRYQNHKATMLATNLTYEQIKANFGDYGMSRLNFYNNLIVLDTTGLPDYRQIHN